MDEPRMYKLNENDIFTVGIDVIISEIYFLDKPFKILKVYKQKRKWWQIWKPKYAYFAKIMFLGYGEKNMLDA